MTKRVMTMVAVIAAMMLGLSTITAATAGVERYQFTDIDITVTSVVGNSDYQHQFSLRHNPCDDSWTATGEYIGVGGPWGETVTVNSASTEAVDLTAVYQSPASNAGYTWYPVFDLSEGGMLVYTGTQFNDVQGSYEISQTDYNHGEYVAESIDEYGPDAHSCIGKPIVSNGKG